MVLIIKFRDAIDRVCAEGLLDNDIVFRSFPRGCCGDTCYLLAEYLRTKGIKTVYVCGDYQRQSHAWLVLKDNRVKEPIQRWITLPDDIVDVFNSYSANAYNGSIDVTHYEESDLIKGTIIDITGDQFGESPIYFGSRDNFHREFEFDMEYDLERLCDDRLCHIYQLILRYIS